MKPKLKDLCCKAGGSAYGLERVGFDITGVDIKNQPHYPYHFELDDVLTTDLSGYDAFWASPPCQNYSKARRCIPGKDYPDLIPEVRERLRATGKPYIIENVPGSPLLNPVKLNGLMFGLLLDRERWFECSFEIPLILLSKSQRAVKMGRPVKDGEIIQPVGHFSGVELVRQITGFYWMNRGELAEAIPWQYSKYLGEYMIKEVLKDK